MRRIKLARTLQSVARLLPGRFSLHSQQGLPAQPFFVLGSGRNGSTLLNRILNMHPDLFLPPEQYFLGNGIIKFQLYQHFLLWRDMVKILLGELMEGAEAHQWRFRPTPVVKSLFNTHDRSLQHVLDVIYREAAVQYGMCPKRWGDSTFLNIRFLPEIYTVFPQATFIFLVRDGRDVLASFKESGEDIVGLQDPERCARHWVDTMRQYEWLKKRADVLMVRYEDLVVHPESMLKRVCGYLSVDYRTEMLDFHQSPLSSPMYEAKHHGNVLKPLSPSSIGRWKRMTTEDQAHFEVMEESLIRYGYQ